MSLKEEFENSISQIQNDLQEGSSSFLSFIIKDLLNDSEKFMVFYDVVMNSPECLNFEIYKAILGPLNAFHYYQEISRLYIKTISLLLKDKNERHLLDFVNLIYSHSSKYLNNLFNTPSVSCLTTSLIMFGEFLFLKGWLYESYKMLYISSQSIVAIGQYPPKDIMSKYLKIVCIFFLREGYFYSFLNGIEKLSRLDKKMIENFGTREEFQMIFRCLEHKNEGTEYTQLLCKTSFLTISQINEFINNLEMKKEDDKNYYVRNSSLITKFVDFNKWELYFKTVGKELEVHDLSFISFLKRNNFMFEVKDKKVKVGKYKFKSISDNIYDIIEQYRETNKLKEVTTKKIEPVINVKTKDLTVKKKVRKFKDNYFLKKAKFVVYCLILSNAELKIDMKNEYRRINSKTRFEKLNVQEEKRRNRIMKHYEAVKELLIILKVNMKNKKEKMVNYTPLKTNRVIKTNWRDIEADDVSTQRSTYTSQLYKGRNKEEDILSSRTITSFDRSKICKEEDSAKVYRPPASSAAKDLKIFMKDEEIREEKKGKYIPPNLRK